MKWFSWLLMVACLHSPTSVGKTYTPAQLKKMVSSKKFPKVGPPQTTTKSIGFDDCKTAVAQTFDPIKKFYPVVTVVNTEIIYIQKLWTNDAEVLITCSKPDKQMTYASSPYQ